MTNVICLQVPRGFDLLRIGSIIMAVAVAIGVILTLWLADRFQRTVEDAAGDKKEWSTKESTVSANSLTDAGSEHAVGAATLMQGKQLHEIGNRYDLDFVAASMRMAAPTPTVAPAPQLCGDSFLAWRVDL